MTAPAEEGVRERSLVVCYGGTFDPVHLGHVGAALDVRDRSHCEVLKLIPAAQPPHRAAPGAGAEDRLRMLELAFAGESRIEIDGIELARRGPSYTVATLEALRATLGEYVALGWVLGTDALAGLERWHRWERLPELAHLLVLERPGHALPARGPVAELLADRWVSDAQALRSSASGRSWCVGQRPVDVSATRVRAWLARGVDAGAAPVGLLSPAVWAYICEQGLYGIARP